MSPEEQNETLQRIVSLVLQENSDTWAEIKVRFSGLVNTASSSMTKKKGDGTEVSAFLPDESGFLYNSLRVGMYQRGKGAWYNAWTVIEPSGASTTDFVYDVPPVFANPVDPRSFYEDIRYFLRTVERTPSWLMEKLREAKRLQQQDAD